MSASDLTTRVEYRQIPEVEGYRFGSNGIIETCWGAGRSAKPDANWRPMTYRVPGKRGYYRINLKVNGVLKTIHVHTMILWAFKGPKPDGMECRHLDGNKLNNNIDNLEWGLPVENVADQFRHGTHAIGERRNSAKFTEDKVREIRRRHEAGEGVTSLARELGVNHNAIRCIVIRKTWKHVV